MKPSLTTNHKEFTMKKIAVFALALASFNAFGKVELSDLKEKKEFDQYLINSDKAATVTVKVDVETRRVDCHGLGTLYTKDVLSNGEIIVTKEYLMHTMQMCKPGTDYVATSGITFKVVFKNKWGGTERLLVPTDAKVILETK